MRFAILLLILLSFPTLRAEPLYNIKHKEHLAYFRLPLPWMNSPALSRMQSEKIMEGLLEPFNSNTKFSHALRHILSKSTSPLEALILPPPKNSFIPMPSVILRIRHVDQADVFSEMLQNLLVGGLNEISKKNNDWIKFKRIKNKDGVIVDHALYLGQLWIESKKGVTTLYYNSKEESFYNDYQSISSKNALSQLETKLGTQFNDFFFIANPILTLNSYKTIVSGLEPTLWRSLQFYGIHEMQQILSYSKGQDKSFQLCFDIRWINQAKNFITELKAVKNTSINKLSNSSFWGSLNIAPMSSRNTRQFLSLLFPNQGAKIIAYERLWNTFNPVALSFDWPEESIAPVFSLKLKKPADFDKELKNIIRPYARFTKEVDGKKKYTHILWLGNTLSYRIEDDQLTFSPLLHALRDLEPKAYKIKSSELARIEYPVKGNSKQAYYAILHTVFQTYINLGHSVDPNQFPAFSTIKLSKESWNQKASLQIQSDSKSFKVNWNQPYGLPGLMSSINTSSASFLNFVSLLSLTIKSF